MEEYNGLKVSSFKSRFVSLCDENPMNATALADALNVSKQTISAWKNGTRSPRDLTIRAIADHFGVSIKWLMGFNVPKYEQGLDLQLFAEDIKAPKTHEAKIISGGIDKMPEEKRKKAIQMLQLAFEEYADYFKEDHNDDT